jgi:hypothetical protein
MLFACLYAIITVVRGLGYIFVVALPGTFTAAFWSFVLRLAGLAGELVGRLAKAGGNTVLGAIGLLLAVAGQLYAALIFSAFILRSSANHLHGTHPWIYWLGWTVSGVVATAPPLIAALDWARQPTKATACTAARITWVLTILGAILFIKRPGVLLWAWGWVPVV